MNDKEYNKMINNRKEEYMGTQDCKKELSHIPKDEKRKSRKE